MSLRIRALLLIATGCTGPWVKFEPTKYDYSSLNAIAVMAIPLEQSDESAVEACRVERIGYLRCSPDCETNSTRGAYQYYGTLPEYAASFGATHILRVNTGEEISLTGYASPYGMNTWTAKKTHETGRAIETYRLYRVKTERQYVCLNPELRPPGLHFE